MKNDDVELLCDLNPPPPLPTKITPSNVESTKVPPPKISKQNSLESNEWCQFSLKEVYYKIENVYVRVS